MGLPLTIIIIIIIIIIIMIVIELPIGSAENSTKDINIFQVNLRIFAKLQRLFAILL